MAPSDDGDNTADRFAAVLSVSALARRHRTPTRIFLTFILILQTMMSTRLACSSTLISFACLCSFFSLILPSPFFLFFFLNNPAPPEIYPLPLHAALPIYPGGAGLAGPPGAAGRHRLRRGLPRQRRRGVDDRGAAARVGRPPVAGGSAAPPLVSRRETE